MQRQYITQQRCVPRGLGRFAFIDDPPSRAGPDFDLKVVLMMMTHHQGAIDMSTMLVDAPSRLESDSRGNHIISEQRSAQQMQAWSKQCTVLPG